MMLNAELVPIFQGLCIFCECLYNLFLVSLLERIGLQNSTVERILFSIYEAIQKRETAFFLNWLHIY